MEPTHHIFKSSHNESADDNYSESTNPFRRNHTEKAQTSTSNGGSGKRPRILKPLYSVRLS